MIQNLKQPQGNYVRNCWDRATHPHSQRRRCGGRRRDRRARLRHPWAVAEPGRTTSRRTQPHASDTAPPTWRAPEGARGPGCGGRGQRRVPAAVPVGGGRARAGLEIDHSEPQARVWRSRGRAAAHRHTQRPGPTSSARTLRGIAKGAGISRPLARVPSLIHEGHLDATHQRGDDVVEHGSQRR